MSLALSSVQETPTVGAVSLMANEFPAERRGAEGVCGCASVYLMDVWACGVATAAGTKGKEETRERMQPPGCSGNPCAPGFLDHTTGRAAFTILL